MFVNTVKGDRKGRPYIFPCSVNRKGDAIYRAPSRSPGLFVIIHPGYAASPLRDTGAASDGLLSQN